MPLKMPSTLNSRMYMINAGPMLAILMDCRPTSPIPGVLLRKKSFISSVHPNKTKDSIRIRQMQRIALQATATRTIVANYRGKRLQTATTPAIVENYRGRRLQTATTRGVVKNYRGRRSDIFSHARRVSTKGKSVKKSSCTDSETTILAKV